MEEKSAEMRVGDLNYKIINFDPVTGFEGRLQEMKAYAQRHGPYTAKTDVQNIVIAVWPDRVEWHLLCSIGGAGSDEYLITIPEKYPAEWKLLYDQYGTGKDHQLLRSDDMLDLPGVHGRRMQTIVPEAQELLNSYGQRYLGWPIPPERPLPMSPQKKRQIIILVSVLAILVLCGSCGLYGLLFAVTANHH